MNHADEAMLKLFDALDKEGDYANYPRTTVASLARQGYEPAILRCIEIARAQVGHGAVGNVGWARAIVALSAGWDEHGSTGPKFPYSWETVARLAMDYAKAALKDTKTVDIERPSLADVARWMMRAIRLSDAVAALAPHFNEPAFNHATKWLELNDAQRAIRDDAPMKLHFTNDWLRRTTATDPAVDIEAGPTIDGRAPEQTSAAPATPDADVVQPDFDSLVRDIDHAPCPVCGQKGLHACVAPTVERLPSPPDTTLPDEPKLIEHWSQWPVWVEYAKKLRSAAERLVRENAEMREDLAHARSEMSAVKNGQIIPWELQLGELGMAVTWANGQQAAWRMKVAPSFVDRLKALKAAESELATLKAAVLKEGK